MSDINQNNQPALPGFEEYPEMTTSVMPDYNQLLSKKVSSVKSGFDPHALMVKKKDVNSGEIQDNTPTQTWPERDVKILEDFCTKHGILGFNCGRMSPIAAMAMLKQSMGIVDGPLEERVPLGYSKPQFNPNYPYMSSMNKKSLLSDGAEKKALLKG